MSRPRLETLRKKYSWIVERASGGEPVPIETDRPDMRDILDFLGEVELPDPPVKIQLDNDHGLMWVVPDED